MASTFSPAQEKVLALVDKGGVRLQHDSNGNPYWYGILPAQRRTLDALKARGIVAVRLTSVKIHTLRESKNLWVAGRA